MSHILIIDDDIQVCETMESLITRLGHDCRYANTLNDGLRMASEIPFDVIFLDVRLPDGDGLEALPEVKDTVGDPEVIILTGKGDPDGAELAIQGGVWDYLLKPSPVKQISLTLTRALKYREEKRKSAEPAAHFDVPEVVGRSQAMRACFAQAAQAAASGANVLLTGETGTGKELFARTIHENSTRSERDFVVVDCASLTESLVESILFGHKKGAFTGAQNDRTGLIKLADGGTLFLDEVGEMPLSMQRVFLRVLQERRFRPVGDTREIRSDFRLISATNKDLTVLVEQGTFRRDLLYRLKTIHISLPPLRLRQEDLEPLAAFFSERLSSRYGAKAKGLDPDFVETLKCYDWPGNVRELANVMERAFVASGADPNLYAKHLPSEVRIKATQSAICRGRALEGVGVPLPDAPDAADGASSTPPCAFSSPEGDLSELKDFKNQAECHYLKEIIARTGGDVKNILNISGLSRSHFYSLLKKHGIDL